MSKKQLGSNTYKITIGIHSSLSRTDFHRLGNLLDHLFKTLQEARKRIGFSGSQSADRGTAEFIITLFASGERTLLIDGRLSWLGGTGSMDIHQTSTLILEET